MAKVIHSRRRLRGRESIGVMETLEIACGLVSWLACQGRPQRNLNLENCVKLLTYDGHPITSSLGKLIIWKPMDRRKKLEAIWYIHSKGIQHTLKGIQLRPLTKMRLIGERDAGKRSGTRRSIGACFISIEDGRRVEIPMRPEDCEDQSGFLDQVLGFCFLR